MNRIRLVVLGITLLLLSCSSSTEPTTNPTPETPVIKGPVVTRSYDSARRGVQITQIYFHQDSNAYYYGLKDEWIVIESDGVQSIAGWMLDAGDAGQRYALPDTIHRKLLIYTHAAPNGNNDTSWGLNLSSGKWIWNNADPDTARVYDETGRVVDSLSYTGKK